MKIVAAGNGLPADMLCEMQCNERSPDLGEICLRGSRCGGIGGSSPRDYMRSRRVEPQQL